MAEPSLGEIVKRRRKELGMTQTDVAKAVGISKGYLSMIEHDYNPTKDAPPNVSLSHLKGLARALRLPEASVLSSATTPEGYELARDAPMEYIPSSERLSEIYNGVTYEGQLLIDAAADAARKAFSKKSIGKRITDEEDGAASPDDER